MQKRILIVDNERDLLDVLECYLTEEGFDVYTSTGEDDIHLLMKKYNPDLVVLDYIFHKRWGINGNDLCYQIKASKRTRHIPVVILSASPVLTLPSAKFNYDKFIPKPFDLNDLLHQFEKTIMFHKQNDDDVWTKLIEGVFTVMTQCYSVVVKKPAKYFMSVKRTSRIKRFASEHIPLSINL